ncbi:unnamed protein product [Litomosoides sigmodontis]|uniref:EGF-like domain-containing protein n=1 Tax=Litomosoides sigmodontis TaxID=42156 RepID=A0A3P6UG39_LITSI|nr:unnamed protein product [Litomosoides sigmodontis]
MVNVNGICVKGSSHLVKQCEIHQILADGQCLDVAVIGGICQIDLQCSGGANCLNQRCACPLGTVQNNQICEGMNCSESEILINGRCLPRVIPGGQCRSSAQCLDGSECSPIAHACICPEGMYNIGGYCRKLSYTDPCDSASMIYANNSCVPMVKPGDRCAYDSQCLGGSVCTDGHCNCTKATANINGYCIGSTSCNEDEVYLNNRCFKRVPLNESCHVSEQCPSNAICNYAAKCACPLGMIAVSGSCQLSQINYCKDIEVMVNGRCVKRRVPGSACITSEQCLDESNCLNGYCRCVNGTKLLSRYCIRRDENEKCDTYQTYVNGKCLDLAVPGENCIDSLQCVAASTCRAGKCMCLNGYIEVKKYCIRDVRPSTECSSSQVFINGHCYEFAKIGEYCTETTLCLSGSICYNNYCSCPKDTVVQNGHCRRKRHCLQNEIQIDGQCYPLANIGQSCQFTEQCASISVCLNGLCICPPGTVPQNNICISSGPCPTGQIYVAGRCWDIAYIGQPCVFTQQCQGFSMCIGGTCQCRSDKIVRNGLCTKDQCSGNEIMIDGICFNMAKINDFCYYTKQCQGNATCQSGKCTCPSGTVNFNNTCIINAKCQPYQISVNDSCLDTVSIGMTCQHNSQCIESASCVPGINLISSSTRTCQCNSGTIFTGSKCLPSPVHCPSSTVYIADKICYPLVQIGQFCFCTVQCMGYSICSRQICKCPPGHTAINSVCRRTN